MTGDVIAIGKCGENINYVLFSDGRLILRGTGAMYDYGNYESTNKSPFYDSSLVKSVVISEGITVVGEYAFVFCSF